MKFPRVKINYKVVFGCGIFGILLLVSGFYFGFNFLPKFINRKLLESKILRENTEQWKTFLKMPFPFSFKVHLFTIENHEEVLKGGKPVVKDRGPYVYKLYRWKDDINWNYVSDEVSYYEYERYEFDQEASGELAESDKVTILNTPYLSFLYTAESNEATAGLLPVIDEALEPIFAENNSPFLVNVTVRDYLFKGIRICKNGCADDGFVPKMVCGQIRDRLNVTNPMTAEGNDILYSTLHYRNNTHQGYITVNSGRDKNEEIGIMTHLNNKPYVKAWLDDEYKCNKVDGAAAAFPLNLSPKTKFQAFSADICRSIKFNFSQIEMVGPVKGYKYVALKTTFSNPNDVPENQCFCTNQTKNLDGNYGCLYDGVTDLTTCQGNTVCLFLCHEKEELMYTSCKSLLVFKH